jgi:hypothetical protein
MLFSVTFHVGMREVWMLQSSVAMAVKGCVEEEGSIPLRSSSTMGGALCAC